MDEINRGTSVCKENRILQGSVAAAAYGHRLAGKESSVADGAIGYAFSCEGFLAVNAQFSVFGTGSDNHRLCIVIAACGVDGFFIRAVSDSGGFRQVNLSAAGHDL